MPLIQKLSKISSQGHLQKCLWALSKAGLVSSVPNAKYPGFRLAYGGLDHLALHAHCKSNVVYSVGNRIGTGKESDIIAVAPPPPSSQRPPAHSLSGDGSSQLGDHDEETGEGEGGSAKSKEESKEVQYALKIHRLGRISFRSVKNNRDYRPPPKSKSQGRSGAAKKTSGSGGGSQWMHLSRLAALKEWTFMSALYSENFPVPKPIAHNRHTIVMELIRGFPLRQISHIPDPQTLYAELIELILRLARHGLIHGDFNEFNILVREDPVDPVSVDAPGVSANDAPPDLNSDEEEEEVEKDRSQQQRQPFRDTTDEEADERIPEPSKIKLTPIMIDFPQMVSTSHPDARHYFERDVNCIKRYFERRFGFTSDEPGPFFEDALATAGKDGAKMLDVEAYASGFSKKMAKELETYMADVGGNGELGLESLSVAEGHESGGSSDEDVALE